MWRWFKRTFTRLVLGRMTLTELRDKANTVLTPLWSSVQIFENNYFHKNNTYKTIPICKLHLPIGTRFDVWGRVVADAAGYSAQILVEYGGKQYARAQGHGTGTTFNWKEVSVGTLGTDGEQSGPPNSMLVESNGTIGKIITF